MSKVKLRSIDSMNWEASQIDAGAHPDIAVMSKFVLPGSKDRLGLTLYNIPPHSGIKWRDSSRDYLLYVWAGNVGIGAETLQEGSIAIIEHGASADVAGGTSGAELLVFSAEADTQSARAGGHVHILPHSDVPRVDRLAHNPSVGAAMFANSCCHTCKLWLHENTLHEPGYAVAPHYHGEDEIIVVTDGEIVLGPRTYGKGAVISVAGNTIYGFAAGSSGLRFINFRHGRPTYSQAGSEDILDELSFYTEVKAPVFRSLQN